MNESKAKQLRSLFTPPYDNPKDPRNKRAWRRLKREYTKMPRNLRFLFLSSLAGLQAQFRATAQSV